MNETLRIWWSQRSRREQAMLAVLAILLLVIAIWLAVLRPISFALSDARARHGAAVRMLADVQARADAIRALNGRDAARPASVEAVLGATAAGAGFTVARVEPQGDRSVLIVIDAVRSRPLFDWIAMLERRYGLIVDRLSVRPNSDASLAVELVMRQRRG